MRDRKTLRELVIEAVGRATRSRGAGAAGATMGEILKEAKPEVGYVEDYRRVVVRETEVVAYTLGGDPLRAASPLPAFVGKKKTSKA